jgi:REP element-mobilizing transposase RayT
MSRYVLAPRLQPLGPPRPVREDTSLSPADRDRLQALRDELQYPAVRFSSEQMECIAGSFAEIIDRFGLVFYAAALMRDHVHIVAARQDAHAETIAGHLKRAGSRALRQSGLHPFAHDEQPDGRLPTPWGERSWKIFLFTEDDIEHALQYVQDNPIEAGLPRQHWPWLKPYDG